MKRYLFLCQLFWGKFLHHTRLDKPKPKCHQLLMVCAIITNLIKFSMCSCIYLFFWNGCRHLQSVGLTNRQKSDGTFGCGPCRMSIIVFQITPQGLFSLHAKLWWWHPSSGQTCGCRIGLHSTLTIIACFWVFPMFQYAYLCYILCFWVYRFVACTIAKKW